MSNATTPPRTFKGFVRQRDQDLSATDIADFATHMDREEATHSRKAKLQGLLGAALLAGVIAVRTSFVPGSMAAIDGLLIVLGVALVLAFIFMALTAMEASACGGEADRARRALKRLDGQDRLMREALSAGDSGAGFTLLLRSFDVEDRGSSAAEADAVNTSNRLNEQAYTSMSTSQGGGAVFLPPEFYVEQRLDGAGRGPAGVDPSTPRRATREHCTVGQQARGAGADRCHRRAGRARRLVRSIQPALCGLPTRHILPGRIVAGADP